MKQNVWIIDGETGEVTYNRRVIFHFTGSTSAVLRQIRRNPRFEPTDIIQVIG